MGEGKQEVKRLRGFGELNNVYQLNGVYMSRNRYLSFLIAALTAVTGVVNLSCGNAPAAESAQLAGAWKGPIQFRTGAFAVIKDFEFMRVYNEGGTMTESSNYDGVPPTPPAYGLWKKISDDKYLARYQFYWNNLPASFEKLTNDGGFSPGGYGVIEENISLSEDGNSFKAVVGLTMFDKSGQQISIDSADATAQRMMF